MLVLRASLFLFLSSLAFSERTSVLGPVVDLGYTAYAGNASLPGVHFFGGIPYAQAPLGNLRFRAPRQLDETIPSQPPAIIDARNWGPLCLQQPAVVGIGSEGDCHALYTRSRAIW